MQNKFKIALISFIAVVFITPVLLTLSLLGGNNDKICKGVYINNVYVGDKTKNEAISLLDAKFNKPLYEKELVLKYNDKEYRINLKDLGVKFNVEKAVEQAYAIAKEGNMLKQVIDRFKLKNNGINIDLELNYDESKIENIIKKISREINKQPKNATINFVNGKFVVKEEECGIKVDESSLISMISESIKGQNLYVDIPVIVEKPKIKAEDLRKIKTKISSFSTKYSSSDINRVGNLKIAAESINGTLIMPGEVFSMNKVLGPRVAAKGYKEAPVIINGTLVPGLAGGICQVTTTVYNAALLANLQILERRPHGLKVAYVPPGRDATISGNSIDLKFKNTTNFPIYIRAWLANSHVNVVFYGANQDPNIKVVVESKVIERIPTTTEYIKDPTLPEGEKIIEAKPIDGVKSVTYRKVYRNGILIKEELISKDYYKPAKGKVRIGTKKVLTQLDKTEEQQNKAEE
ncbi:Vancomycin resistance protein YoaR, contains peptidoglycan-binding and VanW domains [Caloramator fervidus]|uniref:Vancomycin resistance protein YoaR, contains peptidoglycan-binding and VanW domains n=1 Tax=Caloramator fervidus TaxID=29344 RepID=A0A1H5SJB9_9CLOT|nr:VanW family protein [Caloramator fervidus]SEF50722.1 Vancomycin resistance protein YoaR, contains peptidoglycan-binding and VanW domains [Caloramator fervidus]